MPFLGCSSVYSDSFVKSTLSIIRFAFPPPPCEKFWFGAQKFAGGENAKLSSRLLPDCHWNGKWVTITETIQSTQIINHPSFANGLKETSVLISNANQIKIIAESEAFYRLGKEDSHIPDKLKNNSRQENQGKSNQNIVSIIKNL